MNQVNLDELRAQYEDYQVHGLWYWEAGDWCSEGGFHTQKECRQDFERFIPMNPYKPFQSMTVREHLAAMAMLALLADDTGADEMPRWSSTEIAALAVTQADALLDELHKRPFVPKSQKKEY